MTEHKKNSINLFIFIFSLIIFFTKWYHPYVNFNEEREVKIIFESVSDGYIYFAHFKALANLDLNNSFNPLIKNLGTITVPTGAFILHFIFYSIIGSYSFVILEFIFILLFLIIFYKISRLLNLNRIQSLAASLILFNVPILFQMLNLDNLEYFRVIFSEFYSLRFPRPLVVNIFFFLFILLILKAEKKFFFTKKNSIIFGIISSLLFTSYLHAFFLQQIVFIFYLVFKFKSKIIQILKKNISHILVYVLTFLLVSSPFLINMFFADADILERSGLVIFDFKKKLILIKYLFLKLFKIQFLFVLLLSIFLLLFFNKKNNLINFKKLNLLFIFFYSSIITPFIFVLLSPRFFSHFYHFTNLVLITAFILFFYIFILFLNFSIQKKLSINSINNFSFLLIFILLIGNIYLSNNNYKLKNLNNERFIQRTEFNSIINIIRKKNILESKKISLLTFDNRFLVWATLVDIKYLNIVNGVMVSRTNDMIENDLISTFKYLNLSKNDFREFIKNKKLSYWRYRNENIKDLFWLRYQANSLITFNKSKNFNKEILDFVNKSSPLLVQQLLIPNEELQRLLKKFTLKSESIYSDPGIIIINKKNPILNKSKINYDLYCKKFEGEFYDFYYNLNLNPNCDN